MPLIQITAPQGSLNTTEQDALVSRLSNAVLTAEGAPLTSPGAQSLVWAHYNEQPKGSIYIGGKNLEQSPLRIAITTPQGALTDTARHSLVADIGAIIDQFIGAYEGRLNHWAMLYEVSEGSWGGAGQVFPLADIQAVMKIKTS